MPPRPAHCTLLLCYCKSVVWNKLPLLYLPMRQCMYVCTLCISPVLSFPQLNIRYLVCGFEKSFRRFCSFCFWPRRRRDVATYKRIENAPRAQTDRRLPYSTLLKWHLRDPRVPPSIQTQPLPMRINSKLYVCGLGERIPAAEIRHGSRRRRRPPCWV